MLTGGRVAADELRSSLCEANVGDRDAGGSDIGAVSVGACTMTRL